MDGLNRHLFADSCFAADYTGVSQVLRCRSVLKRKVEFDSAIEPVVECLRVLIAAFESQVKAIDRRLNQRAGLDRIELIVSHACEVPAKVGGTAALFALMDQPGSSETAPDETLQIGVRYDAMKCSLLMPVERLPLKVHTDIILI